MWGPATARVLGGLEAGGGRSRRAGEQGKEVGPFSDGLAAVAVGTDPNAKSVIHGSTEHGFYTYYIIRDDLRDDRTSVG